jgi:8-oxo-dGTP pyrophosphatase MutT (NUDIX family)
MEISPGILARGPWQPEQIRARWSEQPFEPPEGAARAADAAIAELAARGSPSHDGLSTRLASFEASATELLLDLQPTRWALRLSQTDASQSLAAMCLVRAADGSWLAGRRASWLASWPGRWALGAGGSVDPGESPVTTLTRELEEEWSVTPARLRIELLECLPQYLVMFVGMAWLADGASVIPDDEHEDYAWWPPEPDRWPPEADGPVRKIGAMLAP